MMKLLQTSYKTTLFRAGGYRSHHLNRGTWKSLIITRLLCSKRQSEAAEHILKCLFKMRSMEMLGLTRTPAMATPFFNKPECERKSFRKAQAAVTWCFSLAIISTTFRLKAQSAKHQAWMQWVKQRMHEFTPSLWLKQVVVSSNSLFTLLGTLCMLLS